MPPDPVLLDSDGDRPSRSKNRSKNRSKAGSKGGSRSRPRAGSTSGSGSRPGRHPAGRREGRFSLRPAPGHDPTVLIVICVVLVVALITAALSVVYHVRGGTTPPRSTTAGHASGSHASTGAGGKSTVAQLIVPATVTVKSGTAPKLPWPASGQAIVAVSRLGVVGQSGGNAARPIASLTKVMTAYLVLHDHPLKSGASGPTITPVSAGEQLSEYQALQALLVASGDNVAQILARWDAGSIPAFVRKMNDMAKSLDMTSTTFVDPDGLSSGSVSNSKDLTRLASVALSEPVLIKIAGTTRATIPLNTLKNDNTLLGQDGVFGIKTGSSTPAGGCLMFAADRKVNGRSYTIYGVVLGAPGSRATSLKNAMAESRSLIRATGPILKQVTLIKAGTPIASVRNAAGQTSTYAVTHDVTVTGWKGLAWHLRLSTQLKSGQGPGQVIVQASSGKLTVPLTKVTPKK